MSDDHECRFLFAPPSFQDHKQGVLNATVVLVMYGDYQCSQSAYVYQLIKIIRRQFAVLFGESYLCFIFRHFPQTQTHSYAQRAAEAGEAAAIQGQFWQMHEILFTHQQMLGDGYLVEYANDLGLDVCQFLREMYKHTHLDHINQDVASGIKSGVTATPALFINGIRYCDRWNPKRLIAAIVPPSH